MIRQFRLAIACGLMVHCAVWCSTGTVSNRPPLAPNAFNPLPLTAVKARGWLQTTPHPGRRNQRPSRRVWPDVGPEQRLVGRNRRELGTGSLLSWTAWSPRIPAGDQRLIAKAKPWVDWTLTISVKMAP